VKKEIVILGSGAQGKITADLCRDMGLSLYGYLDDTKAPGTKVNGLAVTNRLRLAWATLMSEQSYLRRLLL
jgi:ketol-acid reductoisomerase